MHPRTHRAAQGIEPFTPAASSPCYLQVNRPASLYFSGKSELTVCETAGRAGRKWAKCFLPLEEREPDAERPFCPVLSLNIGLVLSQLRIRSTALFLSIQMFKFKSD